MVAVLRSSRRQEAPEDLEIFDLEVTTAPVPVGNVVDSYGSTVGPVSMKNE